MATQENVVTRVAGSGIVKHADGTQTKLRPGITVQEGDIVITAPGSEATIMLAGAAVGCGGPNGDAVAIDKTALDFFSDEQDVKVVETTPNEIANDNAIAGVDLNDLEVTAAGFEGGDDTGQNFYVIVQPISTYTAPIPYQNLNSTGTSPVVNQYIPFGVTGITPLAQLISQATPSPTPTPDPTPNPPPEPPPVDPPPVDPPPVDPPPVDPPPPPPPEPVYPTVTVDIEVDPGTEKLVGTYTNADTVTITVTGSDGSTRDFTATINPDGTWTVDLTGVTFDEDVTYTATATATNTYGTATSNDNDVYDIVDPPPPPPEDEDDDQEDENDDDNPPVDPPPVDPPPPDPDPEPDGQNPGNDKPVGDSPWDGETGDSGQPGNGQPQDGVDNNPNNPPGNPDGTNNSDPVDPTPDPQPEDPPIIDDGGNIPLPDDTTGSNPGNDKDVGGSPWDGETGSSGQSGNGQTQDGTDTNTNNPPSQQDGTQDSGSSASDPLTVEDLLDPVPPPAPTPTDTVMPDTTTTGNGNGSSNSNAGGNGNGGGNSPTPIDDTTNQIIQDIANQGKNAAKANGHH